MTDLGCGMSSRHPLLQLILARLREFYREPEVIFWVYGFPVLLAVGLGIAFWNRAPEPPVVDVQEEPGLETTAATLLDRLRADGIQVELQSAEACRQRYRTGKTALYVIPTGQGYTYVYDPTRQESILARCRVDDVILRFAAGIQEDKGAGSESAGAEETRHWRAGTATWQTTDSLTEEPG